jgi:hypothetical protein
MYSHAGAWEQEENLVNPVNPVQKENVFSCFRDEI